MKKLIYILIFVSASAIGQTTYYISQEDGDADYTSYDALISSVGTLTPGDSILFRAGETWRDDYSITESGSEGNYIYFGRYGTGDNPKFLGSRREPSWSASGTDNVWQSSSSDYSSDWFDNYYSARIFFMQDDSVTWGEFETYTSGYTNLTEEYDFTYNGGRVYVYSTTDPDNVYDSIEVTVRSRIWSFEDSNPESYIEFNGIDMKFPRLSCFYSGYPEVAGATDLIFRNCTIGYVGYKGSGYGYGLEVFHSNFLVEDCFFSDCGRRAISYNLYDGTRTESDYAYLSNIIVRDNTFKRGYHTSSLDLSSQQTEYDTIVDVYFYNNVVDDSEIADIGSWAPSNQVFLQNGSNVCWINNVYVVGNVFIHSTGANILFEGTDTSYAYNNTIIGHHPDLTESPQVNVVWQYGDGVGSYVNNVLYDNLPDNALNNQGVQQYYAEDGEGEPVHNYTFEEKDYNLYYQENPGVAGGDRNFSAHRANNTGGNGYWDITEWETYLSENSTAGFEANSPDPTWMNFADTANHDYSLTDSSDAVGTGTAINWIITGAFHDVPADTINKYDITGYEYDRSSVDLGAYAYQGVDSTATDITSFGLPEQTGSGTINTTNHTVSIEVSYGTDLSALTPTITINGESISPASGVEQDFTSTVTYTVTAYNSTTQDWEVTVTEASEPEEPTSTGTWIKSGGVWLKSNGTYIKL